VLSDLHVHLRTDELDASASEAFSAANVARYRAAARERAIDELGVSEHIYRFEQALAVWRHPFWEGYAHDDLEEYCGFVREHTDLRLGIEADFVPGAEARMERLLAAHEFDYVIGSVHFLREGALDMEDFSVWEPDTRAPEQVWQAYFDTLSASARSGLFDVIAHPDLVKYWGTDARTPGGDLRRFYEPAVAAMREAGVAVELSTAGLRKPVGELYPAPAFLELCVAADLPIALSSDAHRPHDLGAGYEVALELLGALGVSELCTFERRRRILKPITAPAPNARARP
jgi:histidinol-phosphatase (PHP family)